MATSIQVVSGFANSLDNEDYPLTASCLSDHCVYESPTGLLAGPADIVGSYKGNGDRARERFDSIGYRHEVASLGEGWFQIEFVDELCVGERSHVFRCHQRVRVEDGQIVRIIHEEIPGQRERLNEFLGSLD